MLSKEAIMEIKTKHEKYANYKTKKQLAEEGLMPSGKGVELWANGSCSATAIYYDATKATKITELYIWQDYYTSDHGLVTVGIGAVDQIGNVIFDELVKPESKWLKDENNAERWLEGARHADYSASEIVLARPLATVSKKLSNAVSKLEDVKTLVSYNIDYNIPDALRNKYQEVDVMELFANVIKEPMYAVDETYAYTDEDWKNNDVKRNFVGYKWQKLSKCLDHYHVKLKGNKACDYADAIRHAYQKMDK